MFKKILCVAFVVATMSLAFMSKAKAETRLGEFEDATINIDKSSLKKTSNGKYVANVGEFSVERTGNSVISVYINTMVGGANYSLTYLVISSRDSSGNLVQKIKVPFVLQAMSFEIAMNKELVYEFSIESNRKIIKNAKRDIFKINISAGGFSSGNDDVNSMFTSNAGVKGIDSFTTLLFSYSKRAEEDGKNGGWVAVYSGNDYMYPINSAFSKNIKGREYEIKVKNRFEKTNTILIIELELREIDQYFYNK